MQNSLLKYIDRVPNSGYKKLPKMAEEFSFDFYKKLISPSTVLLLEKKIVDEIEIDWLHAVLNHAIQI